MDKIKRKPGPKIKPRPGPYTLKHIQDTYQDLKMNYPFGIFKEIGHELMPNSKAKKGGPRVSMYFRNPCKHSAQQWHRIFKAIAAVKARY